jgi:myosin-5
LYILKGPLLNVLKRRLQKDLIYTDIGDVLISVNPFKKIDNLYEDPLKYLDIQNDDVEDANKSEQIEKLKPHVFKVSNSALNLLMKNNGNQSVVVSGESGAGKTEASKHAINFFISSNDKLLEMVDEHANSETIKVGDRIKKILTVSSIVLESFGNSKTMRNDNSSRFGKYIKINYTDDNRISSAVTETFLLEKSRLVSVGNDERNYHVFYEFLQGIHFFDPELKNKLNLNSLDSFGILTQGNCTVIGSAEKDINEFGDLYQALQTLDCSPDELVQLWSMLACILHLGNVIVTQEDISSQAKIKCPTFSMIEIAKILGVEHDILTLTLTTWAVRIGNRKSVNLKILSVEDVHNNIHALMKWLYQNVFTWLVNKINHAFNTTESSNKFIGILDIFGFEILQNNSFEQLCINYSNECLQKQFNQHVFQSEQDTYISEGLNWTTIAFEDNQIVLDLINKKNTGLFAILEEHAMMNRKPDDSLLLVSFNQAQFGISPSYAKPRFGKETFIVKHFAGDVEYVINGFLMKNNDSLQEDLIDLMTAPDGNNIFISRKTTESLPPVPVQGKEHRKKMASALTVSNVFRHQLTQLMNTLEETKRHYIKCIKPNNEKSPLIFNPLLVNEQLRYSGALEVVRIRKEGYPTRVNFKDFYRTNEKLTLFRGWTPSENCTEEESIKYCSIIAEEFLGIDMFQIGKTYLFLRNKAIHIMHECLMLRLSMYSSRIQSGIRCYLIRRLFKMKKKSILSFQCLVRMFIKKKSFKIALQKKKDHEAAVEKARLEAIAAAERLRIQQEKEEARIKAEIEAARLEAIRVEEERLLAIEKQKAHELRLLQDREAEEARVLQAEIDEAARIVAEKELSLRLAAQLVIDKKNSTVIIIKYLVTYFRNLKLKQRIELLYTLCETDNLAKLKLHLADFPDDINVRYQYRKFTTLYHSALLSGSKLICNYIQEITNGILSKNGANGDNSIHLITQLSNFDDKTFSLLVDSMDNMAINDENDSEGESDKNDTSNNRELADVNNLIQFLRNDRISTVSNQNSSIKSGWLLKRKEGKNLLKRWVTITTTEISYYKSDKDKAPQRKLPLHESFMTRLQGKEPTLKITCPNLVKKSFFGSNEKTFYFQCESELELQEWLLVFRALLEIKPFRVSPSISYIDIKKRHYALSDINSAGETPLHTLARSQSINEKDAEKKIFLGMWLIENGCPVSVKNNLNQTASDIAAENNNCLLKECIDSKINVDLNKTHFKSLRKIPGYSYISIYLENQTFLINR